MDVNLMNALDNEKSIVKVKYRNHETFKNLWYMLDRLCIKVFLVFCMLNEG